MQESKRASILLHNYQEFSQSLKTCNPQSFLPIIIAVSKKYSSQDVSYLYESTSQRDFGENTLQELKIKSQELRDKKDLRWHFIGALQSNKIKDLMKIPHLFAIHSVDRIKILDLLIKHGPLIPSDKKIHLFFQVNTSEEIQKSGATCLEDLFNLVKHFMAQASDRFIFKGLMTVASADEKADECFIKLNEYKKLCESEFNLNNLELSMGMSSDFQQAIKFGANYLRIGTAIFKN